MNRTERLAQDGIFEDGHDAILFYHQYDEWGEFSNFSDHCVTLPHPFTGEPFVYLTGEHRFQAMKGTNEKDHDRVAKSPDSGTAKARGREILLRPDWGSTKHSICWYVMFETVLAKAIQHEPILQVLYDTRGRHIYEDSPVDRIWGWRKGNDHSGLNLLGEAWMHVRGLLL